MSIEKKKDMNDGVKNRSVGYSTKVSIRLRKKVDLDADSS